jgi:DNA polymerase III alpha subunit
MTAINTYLKANYPVQFYTALLKMAKFEPKPTEVIQKIQVELQYFNIKLLPPSLVFSEIEFTKDKGNIRYGLGSIKGVAEKSFQNLLTFRKPYSNKFELFESAKQSKLSVGITSSMIMAGALNDFLVQSRSRLVLEAQLWNLLTPKEKVLALQYGPQFNFDLLLVLKYLSESPNEKGKMLIKESRFQTIRNHYEPYKQIYLLNSRNEEFANWFYERKLLGYSYSSTLYDIFSKFLSNLIPLSAAMNLEEKDSLQTIAIVKEGKKTKSKAGKEYIKYEIEDESASTTLLLFGDDKIGKHLLDNEGLVEEEDIVLVTGNKGRDCIFGTKVVKQSNKIYMKLSELKENNAKI